jgi:hypothetical protein
MQLELILSFDDRGQRFVTYPFCNAIMQDKETFFEFATSMLEDDEKQQLVKISCCIYFAAKLKDAEWYKECNGKFWDDDIKELLPKVWNLQSLAPAYN